MFLQHSVFFSFKSIDILLLIRYNNIQWGIRTSPGGIVGRHDFFSRRQRKGRCKGMQNFIGSYEHNLDAKNRLFVPAKFREGLSGRFLIKAVVSAYPCIEAFRSDDYDAATEAALADVSDPTIRRMRRFAAYAGTSDVTVDAQGRIPIPAKIAEIAGLTKETLIVGMGDHVEFWNPATFDAYFAHVTEDYMAQEQASESEEKIAIERKASGAYLPQNEA